VPQYLNQSGLVTKTSENEIDVALDDQWVGPLADNIAAVLSENISLMIPSDRVPSGNRRLRTPARRQRPSRRALDGVRRRRPPAGRDEQVRLSRR
jgi:uncharacterized lipoprotein YmbA